MASVFDDLRYGLRVLTKRPGYTVAATLALALGIGANTAIFSVINAVILRPLNLYQPDRIMMVWQTFRGEAQNFASYPNFQDWYDRNTVFEDMAVFRGYGITVTGLGDAERVDGARVSSSFFNVLHLTPAVGRNFVPGEDRPGSARTAVISYDFWHRHFGDDSSVIGRTITLDGQRFTLIGILPQGFKFPLYLPTAEVWETTALDADNLREREAAVFHVVGRLKQGITTAQAQLNMESVGASLAQQYKEANANTSIRIAGLQDTLAQPYKQPLIVLFVAVAFLLLIACSNVASLLLARANSRRKEVAIRSALGAGRSRLTRQFLTESLLLALLGGGCGLLLGIWAVSALASYGPEGLKYGNAIELDGRVLLFTLVSTILTGIIFGLVPAIKSSRLDLNFVLKDGVRNSGGSQRNRTGRILVAVEMALAFVLLTGAGLMTRSFARLTSVDPGFNPKNLLSMRLTLPRTKYPKPEQSIQFFQDTLQRIKSIPGVISADFVTPAPFNNNSVTGAFRIEGRPEPQSGSGPTAQVSGATVNYFQTMGIPLIRGRFFSDFDRRGAVGSVIINESLARRYFPNEDPLGRYITEGVNVDDGDATRWQIVGIVGDVKSFSLDEATYPMLYMPHNQMAWRWGHIVVRTSDDAAKYIGAVKEQVSSVDKEIALSSILPMDQLIGKSVAQPRFYMLLLAVFALLGLVLASTGIYGVVSYSTSERTQEIGIRMALGAEKRGVISLLLWQEMIPAVAGLTAGAVAAVGLARLIKGLLFGVGAGDPLTLAVVAVMLLAAALAGCYLPARRAMRIDPIEALRYE